MTINPTLTTKTTYPRGTVCYYREGKEVFVFLARLTNHKMPTLHTAQKYVVHGIDSWEK